MHTHIRMYHTHIFVFFFLLLHQERLSGTPRTHELEACEEPPKLGPTEFSPHTSVTSPRNTSLPAVTARDTSLHTAVMSRDASLHTAEASFSPLAWIDEAGLILRVETFSGHARAGHDCRGAASGLCVCKRARACACVCVCVCIQIYTYYWTQCS